MEEETQMDCPSNENSIKRAISATRTAVNTVQSASKAKDPPATLDKARCPSSNVSDGGGGFLEEAACLVNK